MKSCIAIAFACALAALGLPAQAAGEPQTTAAVTPAAAPAAPKLGCDAPAAPETVAAAAAPVTPAAAAASDVPKVIFQLNVADDAPTILRFVTNYLAVEPTAQVAVVGYAGGIDFMLKDAKDPNGKPYAEQMAVLAARGVAFKVCNNTLRARNLTAVAVSAPATVVPGAVNEIIRLQTHEGYAYFRH
jgi:hypothetical protein